MIALDVFSNDLNSDVREVARRVADETTARLDLGPATQRFEKQRWTGRETNNWPTLHLEDVSDIPFLVDIPGVELYQHRARVRAKDGDIFAAVTSPTEGYEAYCQRLGLGETVFISPEPTDGLLAVAKACTHGDAFSTLAHHAKTHGGMVVHPYMGIEAVWDLAAAVGRDADVPVFVVGPPPPVTWLANDKYQLGLVITEVLGESALVPTWAQTDPKAMAEQLLAASKSFDTVGLKRTRCASAMGNRVFDGTKMRQTSLSSVEAQVRKFLDDTEWTSGEEVLIVKWLATACSPSTQLWIPPVGHGAPLVEGVYEQILEGDRRVFVGSRPSMLPGPVNQALAEQSLAVAEVFQHLGYVGRCSFDFLVDGDLNGAFQVHFTECNGRWGGTSTPMFLVDRLVEGPRPAYRAQDFVHEKLNGARFTEVVRMLGDDLYDPKTKTGHFILYNVGPLEASGKLDVIALGRTPEEADERMLDVLPRHLGL